MKEYLEFARLKPLAFAKLAKIDPSVVYRWLSGEFEPSGKNLIKAIRASNGHITVTDVYAEDEPVKAAGGESK